MAVGKNKRLSKGGKKGAKKKIIDPFTRKEWYDVKAPSMFTHREVGKTLVNKTQGTNAVILLDEVTTLEKMINNVGCPQLKFNPYLSCLPWEVTFLQGIEIASDGLKGRVFEVSLGDLNKSEAEYRKFRLIVEDVQGKNCLTNFHGMKFTRDKLCSILKKWQTLIEANCQVRTTDGFLLRVFCIGFTKRHQQQTKKTTYAKSAKIKTIRAKMVEIIQREVGSSDIKEVVNKLIPDSIAKDIEKASQAIYPLHDVYVSKVKVLRKPKFELGRLMDMHGDSKTKVVDEATGQTVERPADYEPPVQETV